MSFYDSNSNYKPHGYPYVYQYGCPTNFYYDKQYLSTDTTSYLYSNKNETQNTNNIAQNQCYTNRNFTTSVPQYNSYNNTYQNLPLYKDVKDMKISDKNTLKSTQINSNIQEEKYNDKRIVEP